MDVTAFQSVIGLIYGLKNLEKTPNLTGKASFLTWIRISLENILATTISLKHTQKRRFSLSLIFARIQILRMYKLTNKSKKIFQGLVQIIRLSETKNIVIFWDKCLYTFTFWIRSSDMFKGWTSFVPVSFTILNLSMKPFK